MNVNILNLFRFKDMKLRCVSDISLITDIERVDTIKPGKLPIKDKPRQVVANEGQLALEYLSVP